MKKPPEGDMVSFVGNLERTSPAEDFQLEASSENAAAGNPVIAADLCVRAAFLAA
jgi:hypothetical protein